MQALKLNKYKLLNISNTLVELFKFMHSHTIADRSKDVSKICSLRAKDESITEMEALLVMMKEIMATRIIGFFLVVSSIIATIFFVREGMESVSIFLSTMPLLIVLAGVFLKNKVMKEFKDENISFNTY